MDGSGRFVGETKCENIPRRICIPNNCRMEESKEEECHNKKSLVLHEIPEEVKDLYFSKEIFKLKKPSECHSIYYNLFDYRAVSYSHIDAAKQERDWYQS